METSPTEVLSKEDHAQIERLKSYNDGCRAAFANQMGYAYLCGIELIDMKSRLEHGAFARAREATGIPERSGSRYMKFAEAIQIGHVADLPTTGTLRLTNGQLPEKEKEKILKAVHKIADGKTLTALYRDLGVIRDTEEKKHHPRKMTAEQKAKAEQETAEAFLEDGLIYVRRILDDLQSDHGTLVSHISKPKWKETSALLVALNKKVKPLCKRAARAGQSKGDKS